VEVICIFTTAHEQALSTRVCIILIILVFDDFQNYFFHLFVSQIINMNIMQARTVRTCSWVIKEMQKLPTHIFKTKEKKATVIPPRYS
jgi:hypothetical protein